MRHSPMGKVPSAEQTAVPPRTRVALVPDPPKAAVGRLTGECDELAAACTCVDLEVIQSEPGHECGWMEVVPLAHANLRRVRIPVSTLVHAVTSPCSVTLIVPLVLHPGHVVNGVMLGPNMFMVSGSSAEYFAQEPMGKDSFYVTFPEDIVRQGLTTVTSQDSPHLPTHTLVLEAQADRFATLREALLQICDHAGRNPDSSSSAAARRSMERALITSWVQAWISARPVGRADGSRTMWYSEHNLEVALEYLKEHQNQTVRLPDLCRRCGVCLRTMEVLFKRNLGVGPIHYLKLRRMQQVRKELRAADSFRTYVKQVALDAGFWDLGRLAVEYKRMFQEAPSTTLRKREPSGRVTL